MISQQHKPEFTVKLLLLNHSFQQQLHNVLLRSGLKTQHTRRVSRTTKHAGILYSVIRNAEIYHRSLFYITHNPAAAFTPASVMLD